MAVALALFVGLSQSESRSIYQGYDKWLHASVFFLLWWLARISLRWHTLAISLAVLAGNSRRGLTRQQRVVTGWVLGAGLVLFACLAATVGTAVLLLIKVSLGI